MALLWDQWVVHDCPGWCCTVGNDMKVQQTIQQVSNGPGGHYVVGATRNATAMEQFELLFHEVGSITLTRPYLNRKLPRFSDQPQKRPSTMETGQNNLSPKDTAEAHRNMDTAKERGMELRPGRYLLTICTQYLHCSMVIF